MSRNNSIQKYFNGATNNLTAYTKTAKFSDMQVYRIGALTEKASFTKAMEITAVSFDKDLMNTVLAISYAKQPHHIISGIVAGFVYITDVDLGEEKVTYLSPSAAELPSKIFIMDFDMAPNLRSKKLKRRELRVWSYFY